MSTLAKVFVIINLILSIAFITMAGTLFHHQKDWRSAFETLAKANRERVEGYDKIRQSLQGKIATLEEYSQSKENEILAKDSHLNNLRDDVVLLRHHWAPFFEDGLNFIG